MFFQRCPLADRQRMKPVVINSLSDSLQTTSRIAWWSYNELRRKETHDKTCVYLYMSEWLTGREARYTHYRDKNRSNKDMYVLRRKLNEMHLSSNDNNWLVISSSLSLSFAFLFDRHLNDCSALINISKRKINWLSFSDLQINNEIKTSDNCSLSNICLSSSSSSM